MSAGGDDDWPEAREVQNGWPPQVRWPDTVIEAGRFPASVVFSSGSPWRRSNWITSASGQP